MSDTMSLYCAFLELPPELRNIIYEYVARNEDALLIKKRVRPKHGHYIAAHSGLVLVNRQISEEYVSIVQTVSLWSDILLYVWIHDFNFCPLQRYISALQLHEPFTSEERKVVQVHLTISACENIHAERFASWVSFHDRKGMRMHYEVEDAYSGHAFPMAPPLYGDLSIVRSHFPRSAEEKEIYHAVRRFQIRCYNRCYRLRSHDPSKQDIFMTWKQSVTSLSGSYQEITAEQAQDVVRPTEVWID